jgi:oligopeptide/dipeptide ABC transporter ATP-binding protein
MNKKLISCKRLTKYFYIKDNIIKAVNDVSFDIYEGKTFAIVGESGSGKTTIANMLSQLSMPSSGEILFEDKELKKNLKKNIQFIFQDPFLSFNPKMKIDEIILEPIKIHEKFNKKKLSEIVDSLLNKVQLPSYIKGRFPHEFSGGQRQRIAIARAIALNPKFIICDEPLASLDVSISAQIIDLLKSLQEKINLSYLFISHNLAVVKYISDYVAVMYLGKFLETGPTKKLFSDPLHPYTKALISLSSSKKEKKIFLKNENPSFLNPPEGCLFSTRCPYAEKKCFKEHPELKEINENHFVACHLKTS